MLSEDLHLIFAILPIAEPVDHVIGCVPCDRILVRLLLSVDLRYLLPARRLSSHFLDEGTDLEVKGSVLVDSALLITTPLDVPARSGEQEYGSQDMLLQGQSEAL